jgi:hypothetical protein
VGNGTLVIVASPDSVPWCAPGDRSRYCQWSPHRLADLFGRSFDAPDAEVVEETDQVRVVGIIQPHRIPPDEIDAADGVGKAGRSSVRTDEESVDVSVHAAGAGNEREMNPFVGAERGWALNGDFLPARWSKVKRELAGLLPLHPKFRKGFTENKDDLVTHALEVDPALDGGGGQVLEDPGRQSGIATVPWEMQDAIGGLGFLNFGFCFLILILGARRP